jgi:RNA polymerase sigma factor (sigma-70 family)
MTDEVNPYLVKVSIRNNLIIKAIHKAGYRNVSQFCEQNGMGKTQLTSLISLKTPPLTQDGEFRDSAKALMEHLCALPTDLWTTEQLTMELRRNTSTKEVDLNAMVAALGMNTEEALHLIEGSSPDKELENREAVEVVNEMLETLTPKEAKVLRMRFGIGCNEHTLEEAGQVLAVTKERIRQIEAKAMRKMQHPSRMVELWNVKQ